MSQGLDYYKQFVDDLVARRPAVCARWVLERGRWPDLPENQAINEFLAGLSDEQKQVLAGLLQGARDGGIFDVLAYLNEESYADLRLVRAGVEFPIEPFGYALFEDWLHRRTGGEWWRNEDLKPEYKKS